MAELAAIAHEHGALVHTDAVQSAGKIPIDVKALGVDLLSISGHKFYGPKGTARCGSGAACGCCRSSPAAVRSATAARAPRTSPGLAGARRRGAARARKAGERSRRGSRRCAIDSSAACWRRCPAPSATAPQTPRVPNTTNISFERIESESLLIGLDLEGIAVSSGSACSSGTLEPSHVLKAMGLPHHRTLSSIRFSLGASNTEADVDRVISVLPPLVEKLRSLSTVGGRSEDTQATEAQAQRIFDRRKALVSVTRWPVRDAHAYCRRDVGRRGFLRRRGAARRAGSRRHRCVDAALRSDRGSDRLRHVLHDRRSARRAARRGGDRHSALHPQLREPLRRAGRLELHPRVRAPAARRFRARTATPI